MMYELANKVFQEKYFNSIRYFAHTLPLGKRDEFILLVGNLNIYLAAQCVMSGEANPIIEERLKVIAENRAKEFSKPEISAQGFLALSEFEKFDIILSLFSSVTNISGLHSKVISNILSNASSDFFYKFLRMLSEVDHPPLIQNAIAYYNGLVVVDSSNRDVFNKLITVFIRNEHYGTLRIMLNKFLLTDEYEYITGVPIEKSINTFLGSKKFTAVNLACELIIGNRLLEKFSLDVLIQRFIKTSGYKGIVRGIKLNDDYNLGRNSNIDEELERVLSNFSEELPPKLNRKKAKLVRNLFKKGAADYLKQYNPDLYSQGYYIISGLTDFKRIESFYRQRKEYSYQSQLGLAGPEVNTAFSRLLGEYQELELRGIEEVEEIIISLLKKWFSKHEEIKLEILLSLIIKQFDIEFSGLKKIMRKFAFIAQVIEKTDYVMYLECKKLNTDKKLSLSKKNILRQTKLLNFENIEIGDRVCFFINDINPVNFKLSIYVQSPEATFTRILID